MTHDKQILLLFDNGLLQSIPDVGNNVTLSVSEDKVFINVLPNANVFVQILYKGSNEKLIRHSPINIVINENANLDIDVKTKVMSNCEYNYFVDLVGCRAKINFSEVSLLFGDNEKKSNVIVKHLAKETYSNQLFKEVLKGKSTSSFSGEIFVDRSAKKAEAHQLKKVLMLSDNASASGSPRLKIFNDNVKVSHGLSIGQFDQQQLLYCRSRGISLQETKKMLIKAFLQ